jgi:hypothetical protein
VPRFTYDETTTAATASGLLNLGFDAAFDDIEAQDVRLDALEADDPAWTTLTLASGWEIATSRQGPAHRVTPGGSVQFRSFAVQRTSGLAMSPGVGYTIGTLAAGLRPAVIVPAPGTIGIAGTLGSCEWRIGTDGNVQVIPLIAGGTMASGGGVGNSAAASWLEWTPA